MTFAGSMAKMVGLLGAAAVLGAAIALTLPLGLDVVDRTGAPIPCGTGMHPSYNVAAKQDLLNLDQHTLAGPAYAISDYAEQCEGLITERRTAALSVGGGGAVLLLAVLAGPLVVGAQASHRGRRAQYARSAEPVGDQPNHPGVQAQRLADDIPTGVTQPILEEPVDKQLGRQRNAAAAALALRAGGGMGQFYAIGR
ncbi:hypothetical protein [Mycobacterium sp. 155]|uniref:hypothetical protein n=1 Tax=Mycobacterium sp. 155 TaxID=1157943 RepID=UPI0003669D4F